MARTELADRPTGFITEARDRDEIAAPAAADAGRLAKT